MLTHTYTRTHNVISYADPYKKCCTCGAWIDGALDGPGPLILVPCEHQSDYDSVCPSWGPVDGCQCPSHFGHVPHDVRLYANNGKVY
jgi:hypothetical protein